MQPKKDQYQVIIVGGGLVGATLAIALKAIGIDLLVVEAFEQNTSEQPSFDDRTVALSLSSLKILERLGLEKKINTNGEAIKNIHVSDQGHYGFSRIKSESMGLDLLGRVIENRVLGKILLDKVEDEHIEYLCPAKVTKVIATDKGKKISVEVKDEKVELDCELLILAEGARSPLKTAMGFESEVTDFNAKAIVCNIETQLPHNNWAFERFTKNGPLALLPLSRNRLSVVWSNSEEDADDLLQISENDFSKKLEKIFGARLGSIKQVGKRVAFPLVQEVSKSTVKNNCLLIGNSAQSLHPIAGQGLNLALRDIIALQEFIEQNIINDSLGSLQCLIRYEKQRKSERQQTINTTETLARLFANDFAPLSFSRNLILKLLDVTPIVKETFAVKAMGFR